MKILQVGFTIKYLLIFQIDYFSDLGISGEIACYPGNEVEVVA